MAYDEGVIGLHAKIKSAASLKSTEYGSIVLLRPQSDVLSSTARFQDLGFVERKPWTTCSNMK